MASWDKMRRALARVKRGGSFLRDIEAALNVQIVRELGRGYYGVAFLLKSGRVLKVSTDTSEASFGQWLHDAQNVKGANAKTPARAAFPKIERVATDTRHGLVFIEREDCLPIRNHSDWRGTDFTLDRRLQYLESFARRIERFYTARSKAQQAKYAREVGELLDEICNYDARFCPLAEGLYDLGAEEGGYLTDVHSDNVGFRAKTQRGYPPKGSALILDWGQGKALKGVVGGKITLPNPSTLTQVCISETAPV